MQCCNCRVCSRGRTTTSCISSPNDPTQISHRVTWVLLEPSCDVHSFILFFHRQQWFYTRNMVLLQLKSSELSIEQNSVNSNVGPLLCSRARFVGVWEGVYPPPWCHSLPKFSLTPTVLVKNSQKYIADPPLVLPQIEYCNVQKISLWKT